MLGHPALIAAHDAGDPEGKTFFPEQCIPTIARADAPDQAFFGKMQDKPTLRAEVADRVQTRHKIIRSAEAVQGDFAHAGHDAHTGSHVGAVGYLYAHLTEG